MFTITKKGKRRITFYGNADNPCSICGCIFKCEKSDVESEEKKIAEGTNIVRCPCCRNLVEVHEFESFIECDRLVDLKLEDLNFSVRVQNCLRFMNIRTLDDLLEKTEIDMLHNQYISRKSLKEIKDALREHGYSLKEGM